MRGIADRCSLRSRAADEPLAGTASTFRRWLLLPHDGPWGRDGLVDARLPDGLGSALRALGRRASARVLLVRRTGRTSAADEGRVVCVAVDTGDEWIGSRTLDRIDDAIALDPRDRDAFPDPGPRSLFATCTHGRRDPCCAERGRPLAEAIAAAAPDAAWESTHLGGDRFAPSLIAFPHGLAFGRVEPVEASALVRGHAAGRIAPLERYRGRAGDPFDVQAGEVALRAELRLDGIHDVRLERRSPTGDRSEVTFATPAGHHRVRLVRLPGAPMRLTCHSAREEIPPIWRAEGVEPAGPDR